MKGTRSAAVRREESRRFGARRTRIWRGYHPGASGWKQGV